MDGHRHLLDALAAVDPARCSYQEWVDVGMALHESGFSWEDWDGWSRRDPARYHEGECERKWAGFGHGMGEHVKSGTVIAMAEAAGWRQPSAGTGEALDWDSVVTVGPDPTWVEEEDVGDVGADVSPTTQLYDYLRALFDDDDFVGYATESYDKDGRAVPTKGVWTRTAGELRSELAKTDDLAKVIGDWRADVGAWIRFNPLDGRGVANANVTEYRYALVESDELEVGRQLPMLRAMNLPCAAIVSSAGKSVHAIVKVDAGRDYDLYRKRVERLYAYCRQHGFQPDAQNKNPSRLSRLPGVTRGGRVQALLATDVGAESWDAWEEWVAESEDDLPDDVCGDWDEPVRLMPYLIGDTADTCILRQKQKMIVVGDSKMGKSYTLIDLAEAICTGGQWLGMTCTKGRVFYVNLEIDAEEFKDRQRRVWSDRESHGQPGSVADLNRNFVKWNLRGHATMLQDLAPRLMRRMLKHGPAGTFSAVIIDPIYKVNGGDDNDAKAVSMFTNTLDSIVSTCGCAAIYAHHHPKGTAGQKKSMDRMSGSGVYARDADTVLDFTLLSADEKAKKAFSGASLFRASVTCRSFDGREPMNVAFKFPRFYVDTSGILAKLDVEGENPYEERRTAAAERAEKARERKVDAVRAALREHRNAYGTPPTYESVYELMEDVDGNGREGRKVSLGTFKNWIRQGEKSLGRFSCEHANDGSATGVWVILDLEKGETLEGTYGLSPMED